MDEIRKQSAHYDLSRRTRYEKFLDDPASLASCADCPLRPESFEVILGLALIHHLAVDLELRLYEEILNLLVPGGVAIFRESLQNSASSEFIRTLIPIYQKHNPRQSRLSKEWQKYVENDPHPYRPNTTKHYREIVKKFDYEKVEFQQIGIFSRFDTDNKQEIAPLDSRFRRLC